MTALSIIFLLFSTPLSGTITGTSEEQQQLGALKGRVVESVSGQPLEYVNIVVLDQQDGKVITGGISDDDGYFSVNNIPWGEYNVRMSFIGFEPLTLENISFSATNSLEDLGTVQIKPGDELMEDITIRAEREILTLNLDKRVFVVDRDISTTGGSALEIMESLPSVTVDYEGRVSLRGSSNVTILVDGRPSHLVSLDQLPATMIDRVEVITNPSARHDPDGTSGIINIVMKKSRQHGTAVMISTNAGTGDKYNGSVNLNHRIDNWNFFGNYDFRIHSMEGFNITDRDRITNEGDTLRQLHQYEDFLRNGTFHNFRAGTDFFIDHRNTVTLMGTFNLRDTRPRNYSEIDLFLPEEGGMSTSMERQFEGFGREYVLNYTREYDQEGREFVADLFYALSDGDTYRDVVVDPADPDMPEETKYVESSAPGQVFTFQVDYSHPLSERSRIETGVKSIYRYMEDDFRFFDIDRETGNREINTDYTNHFLYSESILSAYGIYSVSSGRFQVQGGLRAEQHASDAEQRITLEEFDRSFFSLFPSAHVRYLLDENNSFLLNYSRRINRPGISLLNPFVNYSDPMNISFGNPELKPEYINSYELGYRYSENRTEMNAVLFYRKTEDIISREMTLMGGDNPATHTTFENLQAGTSFGIELVANFPLTSWWRLNGNVSYFYTHLEDERLPDWEHEGDSWMLNLTSNWTILKRFNLQSRFYYHSPQVTAGRTTGGGCQQHGGQGIQDATYYLDLGLRTDILNGNGTVSLRLSDVFKSRGMDMHTYGESFTSGLSRRSQSRVLFLGFTYRFNDYRDRQERERDRSLLDEIE